MLARFVPVLPALALVLVLVPGCKRRDTPPGPPDIVFGPETEPPHSDPTNQTQPFTVDPKVRSAGKKVYLAVLTPFGYQSGPWQLGIGVKGEDGRSPLIVQGKQYRYGICLHPPQKHQGTTRVSFVPGKEFTRFKGWVGIGDYFRDPMGRIAFAVYGDGRRLWESDGLNKAGTASGFEIDVTGVEVLTLETRMKDGDHTYGHAIWLDPWLER